MTHLLTSCVKSRMEQFGRFFRIFAHMGNFFDELIRHRGDIEATLSKLGWSFSDFVEFKRMPDYEDNFRTAMEVIASKTFAVNRKYMNSKMPDIELKLFDFLGKSKTIEVEDRPTFTLHIRRDDD